MCFNLTYKKPLFCKNIVVLAVFIALLIPHHPIVAQKNVRDSILKEIQVLRDTDDFTQKDTLYIKLINDLANKYRYIKSDSLYQLAQLALKLSKEIACKFGESHALMGLGTYFSDKGDTKKSIDYYKRALKAANTINDANLIADIQNKLATEYEYVGESAMALNLYLLTSELAEKNEDHKMVSIINENIANLYASQNDYSNALDFYEKVKKVNDIIGNPVVSAETMSNVASIYADIGKYDLAMFNINRSISIFEKNEILDWLAYAYEVKGKIYVKRKRYQWALYWYDQSDFLHRELDDDRAKIDLYNGIAQAYLGQNKDSLSESYALKAYNISNNIASLEGQKECSKTLYQIGKKRRHFENALKYHEIFQRLSHRLSYQDNKKNLAMLKVKLEYEEQKQALIEENKKSLANQKNYIYAAIIIFFILFGIMLLVYRNQKMQEKLNKELKIKTKSLEERKLELKEINNTKDKLFSIIGHDLRGPIGALQSLLELFTDGDIKKEEFLGQMPKLKSDVDSISFTLNNLLSWGQTQMNGVITRPKRISINSIVEDNINLLSKIAVKKSIRLISEIPENCYGWADKNQIDIVIRNLLSNALKFTPENGLISIKALEKVKFWEVIVRDTGVGMDLETQNKLFKDDSNVSTYGTHNEKGTGLGLALCKEMVKKNAGKIWVESLQKKGTCFYFTVPKAAKKYKRAG
ncbi:MAG: ATP-binding protein [Bacteroidota bacterium]